MKHVFPKLLIFATLLLTGCSSNNEDTGGTGGGGGGGNVPVDTNPQGLDFYLLDDNTYGVTAGKAIYLSDIVVPEKYNNKEVSTVLTYGFCLSQSDDNCLPTYKVTLPSTIKKISYGAFDAQTHESSRTLQELIYKGKQEDFLKIDFDERWIYSPSDYSTSQLTIKFDDAEVKFSEAFDKLGMSINGASFHAEAPKMEKNLYIGGEYDCKCYLFSETIPNVKYNYADFDELKITDSSLANIVGSVVTPIATGTSTLTIKKGDKIRSVSVRILNSIDFPTGYTFDNKTVTFDGQQHQLDLVKNAHQGSYIYYSDRSEETFSFIEDCFARNVATEPSKHQMIGNFTSYAYMYKEGYNLVKLTATLTIEE